MSLVCIMLSSGTETLWYRVEWSQLLLLPCCPTSEIKGCLSNPQFTLILLHVDFSTFTYNCNLRFYLMPATCIILFSWTSPVKKTHNLSSQQHSCQASSSSRQAEVSSLINIIVLICGGAAGHGAAQQQWKSQQKQKFLDKFSEQWQRFSWCSDGMSHFASFSSFLAFEYETAGLEVNPLGLGAFSSPSKLVRRDSSEILPIGCHLVEAITVGDGNSIGLKWAKKFRSSIWASTVCGMMELRNVKLSTSFWVEGSEFRLYSIKLSWHLAAVSS